MSKNAAASYARSAVYDEDSIKAQHQENRNTAKEKDIPVVREYQDNGVSGLSSDRPGFQEMMADALSEERPFDTIIVQRHRQALQEPLRLHPVPEATGGSRGQPPDHHGDRTALNLA